MVSGSQAAGEMTFRPSEDDDFEVESNASVEHRPTKYPTDLPSFHSLRNCVITLLDNGLPEEAGLVCSALRGRLPTTGLYSPIFFGLACYEAIASYEMDDREKGGQWWDFLSGHPLHFLTVSPQEDLEALRQYRHTGDIHFLTQYVTGHALDGLPSTPVAFQIWPPGQEDDDGVRRGGRREKAIRLYPRDLQTFYTLVKAIITLLEYELPVEAHMVCVTLRKRITVLARGSFSPFHFGLQCYEAICCYACHLPEKATELTDHLTLRPLHFVVGPAKVGWQSLEQYRQEPDIPLLVARCEQGMVEVPPQDRMVCTTFDGYCSALAVFAEGYKRNRLPHVYPPDLAAFYSLRNCLVTLLKLGFPHQARFICDTVSQRLAENHGGFSPFYFAIRCYLAICCYAIRQDAEAELHWNFINNHPLYFMTYPPREGLETLREYRDSRNIYVLALRDDGNSRVIRDIVRVPAQANVIELQRQAKERYDESVNATATSRDVAMWDLAVSLLGLPYRAPETEDHRSYKPYDNYLKKHGITLESDPGSASASFEGRPPEYTLPGVPGGTTHRVVHVVRDRSTSSVSGDHESEVFSPGDTPGSSKNKGATKASMISRVLGR